MLLNPYFVQDTDLLIELPGKPAHAWRLTAVCRICHAPPPQKDTRQMVRELQWKPNATVAAVVERDGEFLLVEEHTEAGVRLNQPAGHWEHGESILTPCGGNPGRNRLSL